MQPPKIRRRHSPLGWAIAKLRREPHRAKAVAYKLFGAELGRRIWLAATRGMLRELRGGGIQPRAVARTRTKLLARFVEVAVRVLEHTEPTRGTALSPQLWQGQDGLRAGLAGAVGISRRQLQRYLRALSAAGALRRRQPPHDALPDRLRGKQWGYCCYRWGAQLPAAAHRLLSAWMGRARPKPPPALSTA